MTHVDAEALRDPERVFVAKTLRQARQVEELLTQAGVDYVVQVEAYGRSFLFGTLKHGAAFYVTTTQALYCRERLVAAGFGKGVVDDEPANGE
jgi:hypothetical protein